MKRTRPLLYFVATLSAVLVALIMFWLALLPNRLATAMTSEIEQRTGMHVSASGSSLGFINGLSLQLNNVSLAQGDDQSVPTANIDRVVATLSISNFLGGKLRLENLLLDAPVISITSEPATPTEETTGAAVTSTGERKQTKALSITLRDGTVRWSDVGKQVSFAVSNLNGTVKTEAEGNAAVDLAGLFNGKLTHAVISIDDVARLKTDGSPSDVTLTSGKNTLTFSGRTRMHGGLQIDGRLSASSESFRDLANWFGLALSGFADADAVTAEAAVSWNGAVLDVKDLALQTGQSKLTGKATLDTRQARPLFTAALDSENIDLALYSGRKSEGQTAPVPALSVPALSVPWAERPMSFGDLALLDAHVEINAGKLVVAGLQTGKASLAVDLQNGALVMKLSSADVAGGQASAEVQIAQKSEMPDAALKLSASKVDAKAFLGPLTGFAALDGPVTINADLTSQGNSTARIISSLGGTAELSMADGKINGLMLAEFLAGQGKGWRLSSDKATVVTSGQARFDVQDGVAQIIAMNVESRDLKLAVEGEIDLLRQNLDIICKPEIAGSIKLPVRLAVSGPWTEPIVDTDIDPAKLKPKALLKTGKKAIKKLFGN